MWTTLAASIENRFSRAALSPLLIPEVVAVVEVVMVVEGDALPSEVKIVGVRPHLEEALAQAQAIRETSSPGNGRKDKSH